MSNIYASGLKKRISLFFLHAFYPGQMFFWCSNGSDPIRSEKVQPRPSKWPPQPVSRTFVSQDCDILLQLVPLFPDEAGTTPLTYLADNDCASPPRPGIVLVSGTSSEWS